MQPLDVLVGVAEPRQDLAGVLPQLGRGDGSRGGSGAEVDRMRHRAIASDARMLEARQDAFRRAALSGFLFRGSGALDVFFECADQCDQRGGRESAIDHQGFSPPDSFCRFLRCCPGWWIWFCIKDGGLIEPLDVSSSDFDGNFVACPEERGVELWDLIARPMAPVVP